MGYKRAQLRKYVRELKMTDMVVLAFDGVDTAEKAKNRLIDLNNQFLLRLDQVVEVVRKPDGQVKIKEEPRLTGMGALGGGFWGLLIGLIFLIPAAGFVVGTISGAIAGHFTKYGITKEYMKEISSTMTPEKSSSQFKLAFTSLENEASIEKLPISGSVPMWLSGTLIRNGPAKLRTNA